MCQARIYFLCFFVSLQKIRCPLLIYALYYLPTETVVITVLDFSENFHENVCIEVLNKVVACQHGFCYFISKFSCDFHNTSFLAVFYKSCCPALVNANDEIFKLLLAWLKVGKHKNCTL